jgi:hypothetical protein
MEPDTRQESDCCKIEVALLSERDVPTKDVAIVETSMPCLNVSTALS